MICQSKNRTERTSYRSVSIIWFDGEHSDAQRLASLMLHSRLFKGIDTPIRHRLVLCAISSDRPTILWRSSMSFWGTLSEMLSAPAWPLLSTSKVAAPREWGKKRCVAGSR